MDNRPLVRRRWRFRVTSFDDTDFYLGPDGGPDLNDAEWIGTDRDAAAEASRRADIWEDRPDGWVVARVVYESQGVVDDDRS